VIEDSGVPQHSWASPRLQAFPQDVTRWRSLLGRHQQFLMAHKPKAMSEVYSHLHEELETRLAETERVGYGFTIPKLVAPSAPKISTSESLQIAA
jgi:hypothetical protein